MAEGPPATGALAAMLDLDHPVKEAARAWAESTLAEQSAIDDSRAAWRKAADFGVQSLLVPAEKGGTAASAVDTMLTFEGLGAAGVDNGFVFALASQTVTIVRALALAGTDDQNARYLVPLMRGDLYGAFAMTELGAGSDPWSIESRAVEQPDGSFILSGAKAWITLAPVCDVALVFASTNPDVGRWGITAFLVDTDTPGVRRGDAIDKVGLAGCPWGHLHFDEVHLPSENVLGRVGSGASIFSLVVEAERAFLYAAVVGAAERQISQSIQHVRSRRQGGTLLGTHQAVSHRIVEMKRQHETSRLALYKAAAHIDRDESAALSGCIAKLSATDLGASVALDTMRLFGASGLTAEAGLGQTLGDSVAAFSYSATADVARNIVASEMRLDREVPTDA